MFKNSPRSTLLYAVVSFLLFSLPLSAGVIDYDSGANEWTFSGFAKTGVAPHVNDGFGMVGAGPFTRNGGSVSISFFDEDPITTNDGWFVRYTAAEFVDYYQSRSDGPVFTGDATWINSYVIGDLGDGKVNLDRHHGQNLKFAADGIGLLDGAAVQGTFVSSSLTPNTAATVTFTAASAAVPEPASFAMLSMMGGIGFVVRRRRKKAA